MLPLFAISDDTLLAMVGIVMSSVVGVIAKVASDRHSRHSDKQDTQIKDLQQSHAQCEDGHAKTRARLTRAIKLLRAARKRLHECDKMHKRSLEENRVSDARIAELEKAVAELSRKTGPAPKNPPQRG